MPRKCGYPQPARVNPPAQDSTQHLLLLCSAFDLCLVINTYLAGTWVSKSHGCTLALDGGINSTTWSWGGWQLNKVSHCRSMHSADCNTDHAPVRCKLALRTRKFHLSRSRPFPSIDCSAIKDPVKVKRFQTLFRSHLDSFFPAPMDHDDAWSKFRTAVTAFGHPSRKQTEWFRDSADLPLPALETKRKVRASVPTHDTGHGRLRLTTAKGDVQRLTCTALHRYWTCLSQRVQCCADTAWWRVPGYQRRNSSNIQKDCPLFCPKMLDQSATLKSSLIAGQTTSVPCMTKMYLWSKGKLMHSRWSQRVSSWMPKSLQAQWSYNQIAKKQ